MSRRTKKRQKDRVKLASNTYVSTNISHNIHSSNAETEAEKVMEAMLNCNSDCINGFVKTNFNNQFDEIDWMIDNLPTLPYVIGKVIDFIFSNGITTGDENLDKDVLMPFLYRQNAQGVTNYSVLQNAIMQSLLYGKCGIRWLDEEKGIITENYRNYVSIVREDDEHKGFRVPVCYAMSANDKEPISLGTKEIDFDEALFLQTGKLMSKDGTIIVEIPDNFCNLRNGTDHENGLSCLLRDKQRLKLLGAVYERLNYDIQYDGPGRLIFWLKDGFAKGDTIDLSASQVLDESSSSKADRADKARIEAKRLGQEIRNSKSDNVILASSIFDKMDHLPRVTKGTEFLEYLQMKEGSIICQCFGLTPELIGLGDVSGNVSMERIIDNAMTNTIVPMRERFATQISPMLSEKLGVPKVYFDKYELKEQQDKSAKTYKLALSVTQIVGAIVNGAEQLDKGTKNQMMESLVRMMDSIEKTL
ncbi:hypothetical protein [uncultured Holdemanella sp.]|uniref:hypothetical protein n=1 Tax=uncultured Holdemanella sp. TaxID=1763549 RepID=UPI0025D5CB39|nr:hypothetical protein [uncultured Holdemanella sp.]